MRRSALFLAFAVTFTSLAGLFNPAAYAAATIQVSNTTPFAGQEVIFSGNIGVPSAKVTLQRDTSSGWTDTRDDTASSSGDYSFQLGTLSAQRLFRVVINGAGIKTPTVVLKTKSVDGAPQQDASPITGPSKKPYVNQTFKLSGNTGLGARDVILQRQSGSSWLKTRAGSAGADGAYSWDDLATSGAGYNFRVIVLPKGLNGPVKSPVLEVETRKNDVGLTISRVGSTSAIVADGYLSAKQPGRVIDLQRATSSGWKPFQSGVQDADQQVHFTGLSRSTAYRLVARVSKDGAPQIVSAPAALTYGPSSFGKRVTYITTRTGVTPTVRGRDYAGTITMNGVTASLETVAVRGNSSAEYKKQGYKLKFDDNIEPFGVLPKGKNFNLLPNLQDHSLVRTAVTFTTAKQLSGLRWTPTRVFTELYLNGKYRGSYELIESIKIEQGDDNTAARVAINPNTGVILEFDHKSDAELPDWRLSKSGNVIKFKDPDEVKAGDKAQEGITSDKINVLKSRLARFESVLYSSNYRDWDRYMDVNSAVDFYLIKEFIKDWDGDFFASVFVYTNDYRDPNAKLIMSPIWDPDRSAGAKTSGTSNVTSPYGWWMNGEGGGHLNQTGDVHTTHWFTRITDDPDFQRALEARWDVLQNSPGNPFYAAGRSTLDDMVGQLTTTAAANDRAMWQSYQPAGRYLPRAGSYSGEISFIRKWYRARYDWMNGRLE